MLLANLYVVNWKFADDSIDYMVSGAFASPIQHAWSLAVEEQFYLGWPLLLTLAVLVGRSGFTSVRAPVLVCVRPNFHREVLVRPSS